ncbi:MAG: hypothetical protein ABH848_02710 [Candidatus Omnitrophota bacterium]
MKKAFLCLLIIFCFCAVSFFSNSYALEDDSSKDKKSKGSEDSKVILPSPILSSGVSPTLSPHISSPQVTSGTITLPAPANTASSMTIGNVQSTPATITVPLSKVSEEISEVMDSGNLLGKVLDMGSEGEDYWVEVRDDGIGKEVKVIIDTDSTIIAKENKIIGFKALKVSDTVSIVYVKEDEIVKAHFISIITGKNLKVIEGPSKD